MDPIKLSCNCNKCIVENKWLCFKVDNQELNIGSIYHHPNGDVNHFNKALNDTINKIKDNAITKTLGDININLMNEDDNTSSYPNN